MYLNSNRYCYVPIDKVLKIEDIDGSLIRNAEILRRKKI